MAHAFEARKATNRDHIEHFVPYDSGGRPPESQGAERHLTLRQIAAEKLGNPKLYHTVRRWFQNESGVINAGTGKSNRFLLVPESVADRVINRKKTYRGRP